MSSRLQLDMRNLSLGRRHLVNAYEVQAGIGVIAGKTVWSMPERIECKVLQEARYINTLIFTFTSFRTVPFLMILSQLQPGLKLNCLNLATRNCFVAIPALRILLRIDM